MKFLVQCEENPTEGGGNRCVPGLSVLVTDYGMGDSHARLCGRLPAALTKLLSKEVGRKGGRQ
jgi:hypothetical protein